MPTQGCLTNYGERFMLEVFFAGRTRPTSLYVGLLTAVSDKEAGLVSEVSGGGYSRVQVSTSGGFSWNNTDMVITNSNAITFPTSTASWGTVYYVALYETATGGSPIAIIEFDEPITIGANFSLEIPAGGLKLSLD